MDVSQAIPSGSFECAALLKTDGNTLSSTVKQEPNPFGPGPSCFTPVNSRQNGYASANQSPSNALQVLGDIRHSFVCSYNFQQILNAGTRPNAAKLKKSPTRAKKS
jgi:hypothetical protein